MSGDDGYFTAAAFGSNQTYAYFGDYSLTSYHTFLRFPNVSIPAGATIVSAYLRMRAALDKSGTVCNVNVYFNDADDAVAPTDADEGNGLSLTATVAWDGVPAFVAGTYYNSPELKTILQTVIDRLGWASGQAIMAVIKDNGSGDNAYRRPTAVDYNGGSNPPELYVEWTP